MGSFLLAAGEPGMRVALTNSRIMVHQPSGGAQGMAADIEIQAREILRMRSRLNSLYAKYTGQPIEEIEKAMDRDKFLEADEAKAFGIIDEVFDAAPTPARATPPAPRTSRRPVTIERPVIFLAGRRRTRIRPRRRNAAGLFLSPDPRDSPFARLPPCPTAPRPRARCAGARPAGHVARDEALGHPQGQSRQPASSPHAAAALEAEEEAGVRGAVCPTPLGSYRYRKRQAATAPR